MDQSTKVMHHMYLVSSILRNTRYTVSSDKLTETRRQVEDRAESLSSVFETRLITVAKSHIR